MDLDLATGGAISGWPHVVQSIETLLSTPRGTRVFRRDFGSELLAHLDGPQSEAGLMGLYVALAEALEIWEPRFALSSVAVSGGADGAVQLALEGAYLPRGHLGDHSTLDDATRRLVIRAGGVASWDHARGTGET